MKEIGLFILVLVISVTALWAVCLIVDFVANVPKQLKRIADALEWRNKNGK